MTGATQTLGALHSLKQRMVFVTFPPTYTVMCCMPKAAAAGIGDKLGLRDQIIDYWFIDELNKQRMGERGQC